MSEFVKDLFIVIKKDFKEQRKKILLVAITAILLFSWIFNLLFIANVLQKSGLKGVLPLLLNTLFTHQALSIYFVSSFVIVISLFYKEKQSKTLEYLLITPLTPKRIWLGKSLFMFLWGMFFSVLAALLGLLSLNLFCNTNGAFIFPNAPSLIFFFIVLPVLSFLISTLLGLIHLLSSGPTVSNFLFLLIGMGYLGLTSARMKDVMVTWKIIFSYFIFLLVIFIIVSVYSRFLTRERIILSGK